MLKITPVDIDPLSRTNTFFLSCDKCGFKARIALFKEDKTRHVFNTDSPEEMELANKLLRCPKCDDS